MDNAAKAEQSRPSPDALLARLEAENPVKKRGSLKIFFGAAPGVGKTYEMLHIARERKAAGIDVVAGVVETHNRAETVKMLDGLEILPRREVYYKNTKLEEMDLDAILVRRPDLVLIDELAHTNAPGSRHPKRYLDVIEILEAGIDVFSTLNVQHLESLNDVVAQITRIRVRETVPDSILDLAEIEVIDITPETLTQRLREGKVYVKEQAHRALKHYFSPGNLTALRELALRRTAQRVDDQMMSYMQANAIEGPWAAGDRVLVCIGEDDHSTELVRYAKRVAERLRAPWTTVYVETDRHLKLKIRQRNAIADAMRLSERLGASAITLSGRRVADEVLHYARAHNITHIVIGKSQRARWFEFMNGSIVHDLVRKAGGISVHVIANHLPSIDSAAEGPVETTGFKPQPYLISTVVTAIATLASVALDRILPLHDLSLVYLAAVLFSAVRLGLGPSLYTAVLSACAYNFFFLPPRFTFTITDPSNVLSLVFFLIVAFITSNLAAQLQRHTLATQRRALTTEELYAFSRKLAGIGNLDELLWAVVYQIASMLSVQVVVLLDDKNGTLEVTAAYPPEDQLDEADLAAAHWSWHHGRAAGHGADTLPGAQRLFLPLQTERNRLGVTGILRDTLFSPSERRLLDALLDQASVGIERIQLASDVDHSRLQAETEKLRNALLTSVSHDLRTPLATIIGALTSLKSFAGSYDGQARAELVATSLDEAERLDRFVGNLLDMTRLEAGNFVSRHESLDIADIAGSAIRRVSELLQHHRLRIDIAPDLPAALGDAILLEQVLVNLLDNASKYTPLGTGIFVAARAQDDMITITVEDEGPGIPPDGLDAVFDKFTRLRAGDTQSAGTGLGLQICRGFVTAMGGTITASNRQTGQGAVFTIDLRAAPAMPDRVPDEVPYPDTLPDTLKEPVIEVLDHAD